MPQLAVVRGWLTCFGVALSKAILESFNERLLVVNGGFLFVDGRLFAGEVLSEASKNRLTLPKTLFILSLPTTTQSYITTGGENRILRDDINQSDVECKQ